MATLQPQPLATATQGPSPFATTAVPATPFGQTMATTQAATQGMPMQQTAMPTSYMGSMDQGMYNPTGDAAGVVMDHLGTVLGSENALLRNARTQGLEAAASRGLQNSSIAAGASQRASLDYAMPLVGHAQDTFNQREQRGWLTGERLGEQEWQSGERGLDRTHDQSMQDARQQWQSAESQLDRQFTTAEREAVNAWQSGEAALTRDQQVLMANLQEEMNRAQRGWTADQNQLDRDQQLTMAEVQNWLASEAFTRDFNAQLATMPINNTANLLNYIAQQAIDNPETFTPDIVSGMSEFFTTNSMDVLSRYFPNYFQNQGGA